MKVLVSNTSGRLDHNKIVPHDFECNSMLDYCGLDRWEMVKPYKHKYEYTSDSFEQVVLETAEGITGDIGVMWSGGIDSSLALIALLHTGKKVVIYFTPKSVSEGILIFKPILEKWKNQIDLKLFTKFYEIAEPTIVTGEVADQLWGHQKITYGMTNNLRNEHADPYLAMKSFYPNAKEEFLEKSVMIFNQCDYNLDTADDILWWYMFTQKFFAVKYRMLTFTEPEHRHHYTRLNHFFETDKFRAWSNTAHRDKTLVSETAEDYKRAAKEFIVKYTGVAEYMSKKKAGSLRNSAYLNKSYPVVFEDLSHLAYGEF